MQSARQWLREHHYTDANPYILNQHYKFKQNPDYLFKEFRTMQVPNWPGVMMVIGYEK